MTKTTTPTLECTAKCADPIITEPSPITDTASQAADATQTVDVHAGHTWFHDILDAMSDKPSDIFMWFLLFTLVLVGLLLLFAWHMERENKFNLQDLVCIDGKVNESKLTRFVAFVISTWGFVFMLVTEKFTEWYFMGYMAAWVSNALFTKYLNQRDKQLDRDYRIKMIEVGNDLEPDPLPPLPSLDSDSPVMGTASEEMPEDNTPPKKGRRKG